MIPTLLGGERLRRAIESLERQQYSDFQVVIVDNSGRRVAAELEGRPRLHVVFNSANAGFGRAVNQAAELSRSVFIATLNDDACASPAWLQALAGALEADPRAGMAACRIRLEDQPDRLDSAGLGIFADGATKQRGRLAPAEAFNRMEEALLPSGCAALYRRELFEELGGFDPDYFVYGEDSDLGLRARLAGWTCLYVPQAEVWHAYSVSAGRASPLKAYYVERNRLLTIVKTFPPRLLLTSFWHTFRRYLGHWRAARAGRGLAGEFARAKGGVLKLVVIVIAAHAAALRRLPHLLRQRRALRRARQLDDRGFRRLLERFGVTVEEIAAQ